MNEGKASSIEVVNDFGNEIGPEWEEMRADTSRGKSAVEATGGSVEKANADWAVRMVTVVCRRCERVFAFEESALPSSCPICFKADHNRAIWHRARSGRTHCHVSLAETQR